MTTPILTDAAFERLKAWARHHGDYFHEISICRVCATPRWRCGHPGKPFGINIVEHSQDECSTCGEIMRRYPELYDWIGQVFGYQDMRLQVASATERS